MPTAIVTPIAEEFDALTEAFDQRWHRRDLCQVGRVQAHLYRSGDVILAQGGLGKVQFAVTTQHLKRTTWTTSVWWSVPAYPVR